MKHFIDCQVATQSLERQQRKRLKESFQKKLTIIKQLPTFENLFVFDGKNGHEIIISFKASLDSQEMQKDKFAMIEEEHAGNFLEFIEIMPDKKIYPEIL